MLSEAPPAQFSYLLVLLLVLGLQWVLKISLLLLLPFPFILRQPFPNISLVLLTLSWHWLPKEPRWTFLLFIYLRTKTYPLTELLPAFV